MNQFVHELTERICNGHCLTEHEALHLAQLTGADLIDLFAAANRIREHFQGPGIHLCAIVNAKSGRCREDCAFCAQSVHHVTDAPVHDLLREANIVAAAKTAQQAGSSCFGIVTSGTSLDNWDELTGICAALREIRQNLDITPACSLGMLDLDTALLLKEAGAVTYHHNLETARSFFPAICTTHDYEDNVQTIRYAKQAGLKVCSGGIFGMGETVAHRIELALTLRELDVDSVPINFLNPIPGTRLEHADFISPLVCLQTIALYRLLLPTKRIRVCGGRERNLRDLQSWLFMAGADGFMIGNYLTTSGRDEQQDRQMLRDLQLTSSGNGC
jgi:biotin synthase